MSMGRHDQTRLFGKFFVAANALFVVVAVFRALRFQEDPDERLGTVFVSLFLGYCVYEVWAFTHGRPTSIDSYRHDATPDRTGLRIFGLAIDVILWFICMKMIKSW
jgi:hypothetical protein